MSDGRIGGHILHQTRGRLSRSFAFDPIATFGRVEWRIVDWFGRLSLGSHKVAR